MFVKKTKKGNDFYLSLVEAYYDKGKNKHRTIRGLGYLSKLKSEYDDPIAHFEEEARVENEKKKALKDVSISFDITERLDVSSNHLKNLGYFALKEVYRELELDKFWREKQKQLNCDFDCEAIFRTLVFSRILYPASKRETFNNKDRFFESFDFSLHDVYRALDIFQSESDNLQRWIYEHSLKHYNRDTSCVYFDCTNYYFEIEKNDTDLLDEEGKIIKKNYRKRGPEKNHRPDPIIELGLLMDSNGIPLAYNLFPGNESEKLQLRPLLKRTKIDFQLQRTIVVADRGLNTSDNIFYLAGKNDKEYNHRDGYIYGQSVRGADAEFKEWVLKQDYKKTKVIEYSNEIIFTHKSRIYPKTIYIQRKKNDGKIVKQKITVDQKQMVYYSAKYAAKQKNDRNMMIARANDLINNPKKYDRHTASGSASYVSNLSFDKETGEILEKNLQLNLEKIQEEEKFDGYYSIVTSELSMSDEKLRDVYRGLIKIEDTFRVTKSNLETRPVYVWTKEHIEAHFSTCFSSLVIMRLLESKLKHKFSPTTIIESLKKYSCIHIQSNLYQSVFFDDVIKECGKAFNIELDFKYRTRAQLKKLLKY